MLLVDNDQAHVAHGCENREPRPEYDPGLTTPDTQPRPQSLAIGQGAMHHHDAACTRQGFKPGAQCALKLRSQIDFRHKHQNISPLRERVLRCVQVDLGLAATRYPEKQVGRKPRRGAHGIDGRLLVRIQRWRDTRLNRRRLGHAPLIQPGDRTGARSLALIIRNPPQWLRKRRENDFTQRPLVIIGGKTRESEPALLHGLDVTQHRLDRFDLIGIVRRHLWAFDHHPDKLAAPEGHNDARSDGDIFIAAIVKGPLERKVDHHPYPERHRSMIGIRSGYGGSHEVKVISRICR